MKKIIMLLIVSIFLISSCAIYFSARYKKSNLTKLEIGMTKEKKEIYEMYIIDTKQI